MSSPLITAIARCALLVALTSFTSCVPYERARLPDSGRFRALHERDLSAFEQRLAAENQSGLDDSWTRLGEAWVRLATCQRVDRDALAKTPSSRLDPMAELLHASLVLEDVRRRRLIYHRGTRFVGLSITNTIFDPLDDPLYFEREPVATPPDLVVWPEGEEAWADELPGYLAQPLTCQALYRALVREAVAERRAYNALQKRYAGRRDQPDADVLLPPPPRYRLLPSVAQLDEALAQDASLSRTETGEGGVESAASRTAEEAERRTAFEALPQREPVDPTLDAIAPGTLADLIRQEVEQALRVLKLGEALPQRLLRLESVDALLWRVRFHLVALAGEQLRQLGAITRPTAREVDLQRAWLERRRAWGEPLAERELSAQQSRSESAQILKSWRVAVLLDYAMAREQEQDLTAALAAYRRVDALGVGRQNLWSARYLYVRLLSKLGKWEELLAVGEQLPPQRSPLYAPYLWHVSRALFATGQYDRVLAVSMEALRDRPYQEDPFMRAVYLKTLESLSQVPFESRTVELLEDMGPRSETFGRVEAYAAVALDRGEAENARAAARWLLGEHLNANFHPRYYAILALAAFLEDDLEAFRQALDQVVARPAQLAEAIGAGRRGSFFLNADEQLARVFREMIPVMAEWGDSSSAEALRQKWLEVITLRAQEFLQRSPETLARPALVELYRIASGLLERGAARAYPERVGALEPQPLVLGTVRVGEAELSAYEPQIETYYQPVASLTLVPEDEVPIRAWIEWLEPTSRDQPDEDQVEGSEDAEAQGAPGGRTR